jgi:cytosine/adenosine deaminase-related metal-dependent hydrolase
MIAADKEMFASGINAVGDISNLSVSLPIKKSSSIHYHTFIELFDLDDSRALEVFNNGLALCEEFKQADLSVSIVPHSPYTVSEKLFKLIADYSEENKSIVCIHNQETESENEMFERGKGPLMELMKKSSVAYQQWKPSELSSLKTFIPYFIHSTLQLVHNTFTSESDINFALKHHQKLFWCLCVNANLFIENKVPDIELFRKKECKMTIGTDSYASNDSLSVLDELKTISRIYPQVSLDDLLKWSSLHGAEMLGIDAQYGSIAKGKRPGIINISDVDISGRKISQESRVKRVV